MRPVTFPPAVWLTLLTGLALLVENTFPVMEYPWSPLVVLGIGIIAKAIEVNMPKPATNESFRGYLWTGRMWRFLIGG